MLLTFVYMQRTTSATAATATPSTTATITNSTLSISHPPYANLNFVPGVSGYSERN
jgi:hypothetical protein